MRQTIVRAAALCAGLAWMTAAAAAQVVPARPGADPGVIVVSGTPAPPKPVTFAADPNPILLPQGATTGRTTLSWNAPAHDRLVIRANEKKLADGLPSSGTFDTGNAVTDGMVLALIDPAIGQTLASTTIKATVAGPPSLSANPNPITVPAGVTMGKTTLTWNAPGYSRLVVRVGSTQVTGTVGPSGSVDTGEWVTDGSVFALVDLDSGKTIATVTVKVVSPAPPPPPAQFTVSFALMADALAQDAFGNTDYCATPNVQSFFRTVDQQAWLWITTVDGRPGDTLAVKWIHPSGFVEAGPSAVLNYSGPGCYGWPFAIRGAAPALEAGTWQAQVLTNGQPASTVSFTILSALSVTAKTTTGALVGNGFGYDYCATPATKTAFRTSDYSVYVWYTIDYARPGDVLAVNWVHPSGAVDARPDQATRLNYSGAGCYGWFIDIQGAAAARDLGNWQVRLIVNGSTAFSLPFTILP